MAIIIKLTSGYNIALKTLLLGNIVDLTAGRHTPSKTLDTTLEVRDGFLSPVGDDSNTVAGGDEGTLAVDHVTIAVTVTGSTEVDAFFLNTFDEVVSISQVRVGVSSTEIGKRLIVLDGGRWKSKSVDEDSTAVRTGDTVHTIEENFEVGRVLLEE